jgi:hypothetical protein
MIIKRLTRYDTPEPVEMVVAEREDGSWNGIRRKRYVIVPRD